MGPVDDAYVISRQAAALLRLGRMNDARALLEQGREVDRESEAIALVQGDLELAVGDGSSALRAFSDAHRFAPESDAPVQRVAALLGRLPGSAELLQSMTEGSDRVASLRARLALALHRGDGDLAESAARALALQAPLYRVELAELAEAQLDASRPAMALRLLSHPAMDTPLLLALRVRAHLALDERDAARACIVAQVGQLPPAERARLWLQVGEAQLALDEALAAGAVVDAHFVAGEAALALGRPGEAARYFAQVPEGSARHSESRERVRAALRVAGLGELGEEVGANATQ
ncbi:MAG: hypothetical protein AAF411_15785 [Myxococcota bacterium]